MQPSDKAAGTAGQDESPPVLEDPLIRKPRREDGAAVWSLVKQCPPLDLNSPYAYVLICDHFRETSRVAEADGVLLGVVAAYRPPEQPDTLFVWQIATHPSARGTGLGSRLLEAAVTSCTDITHLEATVGPSNAASRRLFTRWAEAQGVPVRESTYLEASDFPSALSTAHEPEVLLSIGPFQPLISSERNQP